MTRPGNSPRQRSLAGKLLAATGSSWARIMVFFAVSFLLTPVLISQLGLDLFGVFMLVSVSMALAGPLRGAIRKTITRELSTAVSSGDTDRLRKTFSDGVCLGAIGGSVCLVLTAILAVGAPAVLQVGPEHQVLLGVAIALEGLLLVELFLMMAWHNLYFATHRIVEENAHRAVNRVLDLVAIGVAMLVAKEHVFLVFISVRFFLHTLHHVLKCVRIALLVPGARFLRSDVRMSNVKQMAAVGGWSTANQIAGIGFYQADQILLNLFFGPVYNGIYAIVNQLRSWSRMFGGNIAFGIDAIAADLHEKGDREGSVKMLLSVMKITGSVTAFFSITAAVLAASLVDLWLGARLTDDAALLEVMTGDEALKLIAAFVLVVAPATIIAETHTAAAHIFYGMGLIKTYSIPMFFASALKIVLAVVMLTITSDPLWVVWATLIAQVLLYVVAFGWIIVVKCGVPVGRLLVEVYGRGMAAAIPAAVAGYFFVREFEPLNLRMLFAALAVMGVVHGAFFLTVCLSRSERARLLGMGTTVVKRAMKRTSGAKPTG